MASNRTPPFEAWPAWSTAKFFGFIRSGLREKFNRYPPKYELIKSQFITSEVLDDNGDTVRFKTGKKAGEVKTVKVYPCAECGEHFRQKDIQVDHINPAGSLKSFDDLPSFCERLFCGIAGLQLICKPCHVIKTNKERGL